MSITHLPSQVRISNQSRYVHAVLMGENFSREKALACLADVAMQCADGRQKRLLIECDISGEEACEDVTFSIDHFLEMCSGIKVAVVSCHDKFDSIRRHAEAVKNGADHGFFATLPPAIEWLLDGDVMDRHVEHPNWFKPDGQQG